MTAFDDATQPVLVPDGLRVLHVDDDLLAFDKPSGLLSVPGRGADKQDCLATRALAQWPDARVVHRLDQPVVIIGQRHQDVAKQGRPVEGQRRGLFGGGDAQEFGLCRVGVGTA